MLASLPTQPQTTDGLSYPAPINGVNAIDPLSAMGMHDSIFCFNMVHGQYGLKVRRGYEEHVINLGDPVRTFVSYIDAAGAAHSLFALTVDGIWDVTASDDTPVIDTAWASQTGLAGWAIWTNFVTIAGQFIALCDEVNGYHTFDGSTWTDVAAGGGAGQINGVNPNNLVFVLAWKDMLLFVERDSTKMWYLPVGQLTGTVNSFDFGSRFKRGGHLIGLYNWTFDGGEGIDDYLVAIGSGGDVVIYKGTDPSSAAAFGLHGQWNVGTFPAGRRVAFSYGGDLLVITGNGIIPLSRLTQGVDASRISEHFTSRISPIVNNLLKDTINTRGWEIMLLPQDDLLMVSTPKQSGIDYLQFVQSQTTGGWYFYRDLPCTTGVAFLGDFYFGDENGKVFIHTGTTDNVSIAGDTFSYIEFSLLTSFQNFNAPTRYKRVQFLRPVFLASDIPAFRIKAIYDYHLAEVLPSSGTPTGLGDRWDVGLWDVAVWGGTLDAKEYIKGGSGIGRKVAVALRGTTGAALTLIEIEALMDIGGHI